jgi:uracil-DNA glycosylase
MSRKKILLVGEAPGKKVERYPKLWLRPDASGRRHAANRLLEYTGWTMKDYLEVFERTNFYETAQGASAFKSGKTPSPRQFDRAEVLLNMMDTKCCGRMILLGTRVARAFGMKPSWLRWAGGIAVVPHPSGRNRWWNHKKNRRAAKRFFKELYTWWKGEDEA